jgi:hypothetical protein
MPAVLTHTAIMLLARQRLADVKSVLDARIAARWAAGQRPLLIEVRVAELAGAALQIMKAPPHVDATVPGASIASALSEKVSKFAVMGAMGPDIPAFGNILDPGQGWLFDTVHKGNPDRHREVVNARTSDLALEIWAQCQNLVAEQVVGQGDPEIPLKRIRAYVLGHFCHLAADIISHPFINDLEWHLGTDERDKLEHSDGEGSHDAMLAQRLYGLSGTRGGDSWDAWWPTLDEVPPQLFEGYAAALERIYKAESKRPKGFAEFERKLADLGPPVADADFLRDGYATYRRMVINTVYDRTWPGWFFYLMIAALPILAVPYLHLALPATREFTGIEDIEEKDLDLERLWFTLFALPLYPCALSTLIHQVDVATFATRGVEGHMTVGLIASFVMLLLAVIFFVEGGMRKWSPAARWLVLFALPFLMMVVLGSIALADIAGDGTARRAGALIIPPALALLPWGVWLILLALNAAILGSISGLAGLFGSGFEVDTPTFWVAAGIWTIAVVVLWILAGKWLRDIRIPEEPDHYSARQRHAVRLFDEETVYSDPRPVTEDGASQPRAPQPRLFPSGRRPLAKLWWDGAGTMSVRSDRFGLTFQLKTAGAQPQTVPAPIAPMTLKQYLGFLKATVRDGGGATGHLNGALLHDLDEEDVPLPPGATFAAHGDDAKTEEAVREGAAKFLELGDSEEDTEYRLYHAPKSWQAPRRKRASARSRAPTVTPMSPTRTWGCARRRSCRWPATSPRCCAWAP